MGDIGFDGHKKVKGIKLGVLVDLQGLPLSIIVVPANKNDSTLYIPTLKNFKIKRPVGRSVTRFFSWIESCKKVFPRYEIKETSYLGIVMLAAIIRLHP